MLTCTYIALPRPQRPLQHHHVGSIHPRPDGWPLDDKGLYYKYLGQFLDDGVAGDGYLPGSGGWAVVAWGCNDGGWMYPSWYA